jgi:endonuclease/exonuclease/phosphatase family metal-dependent hydrolase
LGREGGSGVRIVSWNVRYQGLETRLAEVVSAVAESGADIVALQEVSTPLIESTAELLSVSGFTSSVDSFSHAPEGPWGRKPFGCLVASKWPARQGPNDWRLEAPFPESFARAVVSSPRGPIDVISAHVPNGSSNGWKKVTTFRILAEALKEPADMPQVLAGDFNEPKELLPDGSIVTFSEVDAGGRPMGHRLWTDQDGETGDLHEWEEAVQAVLGHRPTHRLLDAHRAVYGGMFMPKTHFIGGRSPRWFDHILVSPELKVEACGNYAEWRENGTSDHAGVWADVS